MIPKTLYILLANLDKNAFFNNNVICKIEKSIVFRKLILLKNTKVSKF